MLSWFSTLCTFGGVVRGGHRRSVNVKMFQEMFQDLGGMFQEMTIELVRMIRKDQHEIPKVVLLQYFQFFGCVEGDEFRLFYL